MSLQVSRIGSLNFGTNNYASQKKNPSAQDNLSFGLRKNILSHKQLLVSYEQKRSVLGRLNNQICELIRAKEQVIHNKNKRRLVELLTLKIRRTQQQANRVSQEVEELKNIIVNKK